MNRRRLKILREICAHTTQPNAYVCNRYKSLLIVAEIRKSGKTQNPRNVDIPGIDGVANAVRTRDLLNHNQMLYLLSYGHHRSEKPTGSTNRINIRTTDKNYT